MEDLSAKVDIQNLSFDEGLEDLDEEDTVVKKYKTPQL